MSEQIKADKQIILDALANEWKPREIRDIGASLLRLADAIDQDWQPPQSSGIFKWPTSLGKIERNAVNLAAKASLFCEQRRLRKEFLPMPLLGEPAWDMLLDLFVQYAGGAKVSVSSLCIAADCPPSTALRYIGQLVDTGLAVRSPSAHDKRIVFVELSEAGILAIGRYLERV
jgi:DNA-binding MarR family transcriptional regulator